MRFLPGTLLDMGWCGTSKNVGKIRKACATRYITPQAPASLKIPTFSPFFRNNFKKTGVYVSETFGPSPAHGHARRPLKPCKSRPRLGSPQLKPFSRADLYGSALPRGTFGHKLSGKQASNRFRGRKSFDSHARGKRAARPHDPFRGAATGHFRPAKE